MRKNVYWLYLAAMLAAIGIVLLMTASSGESAPSTVAPSSVRARALPNADMTRAVQTRLASYGYTIVVDGLYGPQTTGVVKHWQKANGLFVDGIAGPITIGSLDLNQTAVATVPATRVSPPVAAPPVGDACTEMSSYRQAAGLPEQFDAIGYRESRCQNTAANSCCSGWWQNYLSSHLSSQSAYRDRIINECGVTSRDDILGDTDAQKRASACVTYVVWSISGMSPWAL